MRVRASRYVQAYVRQGSCLRRGNTHRTSRRGGHRSRSVVSQQRCGNAPLFAMGGSSGKDRNTYGLYFPTAAPLVLVPCA